MPELPEVESTRRALEPWLVGKRIEDVLVRERRLRWVVPPGFEAAVRGRCVERLRRRAKYLLFDLEGELVQLLHLGMSGRLLVENQQRAWEKHEHVGWTFHGGVYLRFHDVRRFGSVDTFPCSREATHPRLYHLGLEPFDVRFTGTEMHRRTRKLERPVKNFLMDGKHVVGVGNIYACESLWRAGVHPHVPVKHLGHARWEKVVMAVRDTLDAAIRVGGTTLKDFSDPEGHFGAYTHELNVYGREGEDCDRCGQTIRRSVQCGRSTFYCAGCQYK